jgi:alpha-L-fucosidase
VQQVQQWPADEKASVPATAKNNYRYLFVIPAFKNGSKYDEDRLPATDTAISLKTSLQPTSVTLVGSRQKLHFTYTNEQLVIDVPAGIRTNLVDVIEVELKK